MWNELQKQTLKKLKIKIMKTQTNNFLAQLDKSEMAKLMQETKETVAVNNVTANHKTMLSAADVWNMQRMLMRPRVGRRYIF
ncbi:hypothetical protein GALL_94830 [mine drainage metagenome]|uniref:Uncharacterized protein n=1 Tax=mine drainage metagenome TaxID=410659 RepID=A0A1J5SK53_9ZZZZ